MAILGVRNGALAHTALLVVGQAEYDKSMDALIALLQDTTRPAAAPAELLCLRNHPKDQLTAAEERVALRSADAEIAAEVQTITEQQEDMKAQVGVLRRTAGETQATREDLDRRLRGLKEAQGQVRLRLSGHDKGEGEGEGEGEGKGKGKGKCGVDAGAQDTGAVSVPPTRKRRQTHGADAATTGTCGAESNNNESPAKRVRRTTIGAGGGGAQPLPTELMDFDVDITVGGEDSERTIPEGMQFPVVEVCVALCWWWWR